MDKQANEQSLQKMLGEVVNHPHFVSFEGGEGSGKSTVLSRVAEQLRALGYDVLTTREPGGHGSAMCEAIRTVALSDTMAEMEPLTEAFLYAASRAQHVREVIFPALTKGKIVLCDRYVDSSFVYQGMCHDQLAEVVELNRLAISQTMPGCTLFFDARPEVGLDRVFAQRQDDLNHMDQRDLEFHQQVYANFKILASQFPTRYVRIDAEQSVDQVVRDVMHQMQTLLSKTERRVCE